MDEIIPNALAIGFMCMGFVKIYDFLSIFCATEYPRIFLWLGKINSDD
jgi:hypothetical protein